MQLSEPEKIKLHEIARQSIAAGLAGKRPQPLTDLSGVLQEPRGAFVTLHLRGCFTGLHRSDRSGETSGRDHSRDGLFSRVLAIHGFHL